MDMNPPAMTEMTARSLSVATVAKEIGVHAETIRGWIRRGVIHVEVSATGRYRIPATLVPTLIRKTQRSQRFKQSKHFDAQ